MTKEEFERQKAESARRIRELYRGHNMPPYPEFVSVTQKKTEAPPAERVLPPPKPKGGEGNIQGILKCFNMGEVLKSPDSLLILGIILLLLSDKGDERLIMALIFIML